MAAPLNASQVAGRLGLCVLSGTLLFLACGKTAIWPLAWFGMVPWLWVVLDARTRSPFFYGWVAGLLGSGGGFYWVYGLLERFAHLPVIASAAGFLLFIAYQALQWAAFSWALRRLRDRTGLPVTLLAPMIFTALELVMPFLFPWYFAITQAGVRPVIQIADITGPLGVSFLLVLVNAALYEALMPLVRRERLAWRPLAAAAVTVAIVLGYGAVRIAQVEETRAAAPKIKIGVVQANIGIREKFDAAFAAAQLALHQRLSADLDRAGADLVVWPETSFPYVISRNQSGDFDESSGGRIRRAFTAPVLLGALTKDPTNSESRYYFNSALLLGADGQFTGRYDKKELLLFGEYIPFVEEFPWLRQVIPEMANYARGAGAKTLALDVQRLGNASHVMIGPLICYEDIIPSFVNAVAALRPNMLLNLTNDAWFGDTAEPWEHLQLSVFRAVEHRLDLVRAVNTGVSAFIDSTGRIYRHGPVVDPLVTPDAPPVSLLEDVAVQEALCPDRRSFRLFEPAARRGSADLDQR
jgi:apolipoprotein N-acyltransferase